MNNRELLEKPFAPEQIKQRKGSFGDVLDYIEGAAVIQRLNDCFDADWTFDIGEHRILDHEVVVVGRLTAHGITKCQFGKSKITRAKADQSIVSIGDDLKAATTDSLKKCATLFGIGLHLYFEQSTGGRHSAESATGGNGAGNGNGRQNGNGAYGGNGHAPQHPQNNNGDGGDNGRLTARQLSAIFALAKDRQWSNKDVRDFTDEMFGKMPDFLTKNEASAVIQHLQGQNHDQPANRH